MRSQALVAGESKVTILLEHVCKLIVVLLQGSIDPRTTWCRRKQHVAQSTRCSHLWVRSYDFQASDHGWVGRCW
jgi:hypothetical protein